MSGWVKWEKDLETDTRFERMVKALARARNAPALQPPDLVTLLSGALLRMWVHADSHIREDNTLDMNAAELDEKLGIPEFSSICPDCWLIETDDGRIELPNFLEKNSAEAKRKALGNKRVALHRTKARNAGALHDAKVCNAPALPDQTRPDQTREVCETRATRVVEVADATESFARIKAAYPEGTYRQSEWLIAERDIEHHVSQGHGWPEIQAGVERYSKQLEAMGKRGTQYVLSPSKFFARGPAPKFLEPFPLPSARAPPANGRPAYVPSPTTEELEARERARAS